MTDAELWDLFHAAKLPESAWTHRAHLRVAWMFLRRHPIDEAHILMRVGIIRLNAAQGLVETPQRGYHETLTRTWLELVSAARRRAPSIEDSERFVDAHAGDLRKDAPGRHYSRERIGSVEARAIYLAPDLEAFA